MSTMIERLVNMAHDVTRIDPTKTIKKEFFFTVHNYKTMSCINPHPPPPPCVVVNIVLTSQQWTADC